MHGDKLITKVHAHCTLADPCSISLRARTSRPLTLYRTLVPGSHKVDTCQIVLLPATIQPHVEPRSSDVSGVTTTISSAGPVDMMYYYQRAFTHMLNPGPVTYPGLKRPSRVRGQQLISR